MANLTATNDSPQNSWSPRCSCAPSNNDRARLRSGVKHWKGGSYSLGHQAESLMTTTFETYVLTDYAFISCKPQIG